MRTPGCTGSAGATECSSKSTVRGGLRLRCSALESLDPVERLRVFAHFGFQRVDGGYVQPPLATDKLAVEHVDLLFMPSGDARDRDAIPSEWLLDTLAAIWSAWAPETLLRISSELQRHVTTPTVALVDPLSPS